MRTLAVADASDEMRALANDLLDKLLSMYDGGRLNREVLLLAMESLALIPALAECVERIRNQLGEAPSKPGALG
nr:hypothetical protein [Variovorax boronicumulans]